MKSKILKVLISGLLVSSFLLGTVGCGDESSSNVPGVTSEQGYTFMIDEHLDYEGTHEFDVKETNTDLVKDGKSDYVLVFPDNTPAILAEVKTDLITLFKKATGVTLPIKVASEVENDWTSSKKYISVGDNELVKKAGIKASEYSVNNIKNEGVRIITKGNTQFLLGGDMYGVCNAVYTFLQIYFNFDYYHRSCIDLDTGISDIKLKNIDATDIPDVGHYTGDENRYGYSLTAHNWDKYALGGETVTQEVAAMDNRMRCYTTTTKAWVPIYEDFNTSSRVVYNHSVATLIPRNKDYILPESKREVSTKSGKMHPDGGSDQLCLSAHGDAQVYEDMLQIATEKIIFGIKQRAYDSNPGIYAAAISCMDNWDYCDCKDCKKQIAQYGSSGQYILFINEVGKRVNEWLQTQKGQSYYREKITIYMFGYHNEINPPVEAIENSDGSITYVPKKDFDGNPVVLNEYADVFLVSSGYFGIAGGGIYDAGGENYEGQGAGALSYLFPAWKAVSNGLGNSVFWYNSPLVGFRDYAYDQFGSYSSEFWKALAYYGYADVFSDHYTYSTSELTGWGSLLVYLNSKFRWNCNYDTNTLIQKYMKAMYKDAADVMYEIHNEQLIYYNNLRANAKDPLKPQINGKATDYPYPVLERWINMFDKAIEELDYIKETNSDLYYAVETRIMIEKALNVAMAVNYHGKLSNRPFSLAKLNEYKLMLGELSNREPSMKIFGQNVGNYVGG